MDSLRSLAFTDTQIYEMATIDRSPRSEFSPRDRIPDFLAKRYGRPVDEVTEALVLVHESVAFDSYTAFSALRVKLSTEFLLWKTINEHSKEDLAMANGGRSKRQRLRAVQSKSTHEDQLSEANAKIETLEAKLKNEIKAREATERDVALFKQEAENWRDCYEHAAGDLYKLTPSVDELKQELERTTEMGLEARREADAWKEAKNEEVKRSNTILAELHQVMRTHAAEEKERAIMMHQDEENVFELKRKVAEARAAEDRFRYKLGSAEERIVELERELADALERLRQHQHQPPATVTLRYIFHDNQRTRKTVLIGVPPQHDELLGAFEGYEQTNFREVASSGHLDRLSAPGSVNAYISFVTSATQWANVYVPACGWYRNNGMDHFLHEQIATLTNLLREATMRPTPEPRALYEINETAWLIASPPFDDPQLKYTKLRSPRARVNLWASLLAVQCAWSIFPYEEYTHPGSITSWIFGPSPMGARPTRDAICYTLDVVGRAWDILVSQSPIE